MPIETSVISERDMNKKSSGTNKNSSPTKRLKNAIREYEFVVEETFKGSESKAKGNEMYKCELENISGNLDRNRWKEIRWRSWTDDGSDVVRKAMECIDTHQHGSSDLTHKIWATDSEEIARAVKCIIKEGTRSDQEKYCENGWSRIFNKYKKRKETDLWDLEPGDITRKTWISSFDLLRALFKLLKYSKEKEVDVDSALTALELNDEQIVNELESATSSHQYDKKIEIYRGAMRAEQSGSDN